MLTNLLPPLHHLGRRLFSLPYLLSFRVARALVLPAPRRPRPIRLPVDPLARTPDSYAETVAFEARRRFWWLV